MDSLIAELEKSEEGSRGLDYAIHEALGWRDDDECGWFHEPTETRVENTDWPHYTTNLQDALGLVPEGYSWSVGRDSEIVGPFGWCDKMRDSECLEATYARTPELSLCIAALKARREA